jgi:hypothetical protein
LIKNHLLPDHFLLAGLSHGVGEWKKQDSETPGLAPVDLFIDQNNGWVVGSNGAFLSTTDGGKPGFRKKFTGDTIRDVYFSGVSPRMDTSAQRIFTITTANLFLLMKTGRRGMSWGKNRITDNTNRSPA